MAISKRLRFEILRRDNHTCRYCGGSAPTVQLTVDHVIPEALGGRTEPANLVAACADCNNGKSATVPDRQIVADVAQDAIRWAGAIRVAVTLRTHERERREMYAADFLHAWNEYTYGPPNDRKPVPLSDDWELTIRGFHDRGLPIEEVVEAVAVAMDNHRVPAAQTFRYFCGICWNVLRDIQDIARGVATALEAQDGA